MNNGREFSHLSSVVLSLNVKTSPELDAGQSDNPARVLVQVILNEHPLTSNCGFETGGAARVISRSSLPPPLLPLPSFLERTKLSARGRVEMAAKRLIEQGGFGYSHEVIASALFREALAAMNPGLGDDVPRCTALYMLISSLGYVRNNKLVKWRGRLYTVWLKDGFKGELRGALERTAN